MSRIVLGLLVGAAIGFGAGYVAFDAPLTGGDDDRVSADYVEERLEDAEILVKTARCTAVDGSDGERWTCEAIVGLSRSPNYAATYEAIVGPGNAVTFGRR